MSGKNKINEVAEDKKESPTKKQENRCDIFNIKSQFIRENLFDFLKNGNFREQTNGILKHNHKLHQDRITLPLREKQRIDSLNDVEKWTPYLKYIYWSLGEIANKLFDDIKEYSENSNKVIGEQECIESIVQLLVVKLVHYAMYPKIRELFSKDNLQLKPIKEETVSTQIDKSIKKALGFKISNNQQEVVLADTSLSSIIEDVVKNYKDSVSSFYSKYGGAEGKVVDYIKSVSPEYCEERLEFLNNLYSILIKFMCLNDNNRCYKEKIDRISCKTKDIMEKRREEFNKRTISKLDLKAEDYTNFVQNMVKNLNLYSFAFGQGDYDIRNYPDQRLFSAIKDALQTQEQKDKFQQFLLSKDKLNQNIKKDESNPKAREQEKQEQPKQEEKLKKKKDESKCEIF